MSEERLILLCEKLLTQVLLHEGPIFVDGLILLCHLRVACLLSLVVGKELLQRVDIKATCLLVNKRGLHEHGVCALVKNVCHLLVCNSKTELLCLVGDELVLNKCVPHHVANAIELVLVKVLLTLLHLDDLCVLVNKLLKIVKIDFLSQHFAYLLTLFVACIIARTESFFSDKSKQAQSDYTNQDGTFASDFS